MNQFRFTKWLFTGFIVIALSATGCGGFATTKQTSARSDNPVPANGGATASKQTPAKSDAPVPPSGGAAASQQTPAKTDAPVPFGAGPAKVPVISVFPPQATVDLERPTLLLRANVNSQAVEGFKTYTARWSLEGAVMSTDTTLTAAPFLKAIQNREGTYVVRLTVLTKQSGNTVGESTATVIAKKDKPIILNKRRYVSTTAGKGMRYWTTWSNGNHWYEGDVDLQFTGSSGALTFTIASASPDLPAESRAIGQKLVFAFNDWKDELDTAKFTFKSSSGQVYTFRLRYGGDGHLAGTMEAPEMQVQNGTLPGMKGSLDLKPAP